MYELIDELWNETFLEVYPLEEESDEEKTFREKAKIFLKKMKINLRHILTICLA